MEPGNHLSGYRSVKPIILVLVAACALPHVPPAPRSPQEAGLAVARLYVECSEPSPFKTGEPGDPHQFDPDIVWRAPRAGTGVVISENRILTAAHVTTCPTFPTIVATLANGRSYLMNEERNDIMFGDGVTDAARLVLASSDRFHLNVAPPTIVEPHVGRPLVAYPFRRPAVTGTFDGDATGAGIPAGYEGIALDMATRPGDSGAPVYDASGRLVGLVTGGDGHTTRFVRIEPGHDWLKGT